MPFHFVCVFMLFSIRLVLFCFDFTQQVDKTAEERAHCFKHLSKSASELDSHDNYTNLTQPSPTPQRRTVAGVLQRTHGFLSTLKVIIAIILSLQTAVQTDLIR